MNTNSENEQIGARVRARREHLHRTQAEIAAVLSISRGNYSKYEAGDVGISAQDLARLARILNVPVAYFYGEEELPEIEYEPIMDELHSASYNGSLGSDDVDEIAEYIRMKARRRAERQGRA